MQNPLVSIIIPNFNHASYLDLRINTVLSQTYTNYEIILLDDCSTDNSVEVINRFRFDKRFKHIVCNEINSGSAFRQWDKGISLSKGDFIWIAESDDWCEPSLLETIINGMQSYENCVLGYCQSYYVEDENNIIWQTSHPVLADRIKGSDFISSHMINNTAIYNASMAVFKKEAFEKLSKDFLEYKFCGDWFLWIELSNHGNVFISGKQLNYFRKHKKSASNAAVVSGENIEEEVKMFTSLYKSNLITHKDFLRSCEHEYIQFKAVKKYLPKARVSQIRNLLFSEDGIKVSLKKFYRKFYTGYLIERLFNKLSFVKQHKT